MWVGFQKVNSAGLGAGRGGHMWVRSSLCFWVTGLQKAVFLGFPHFFPK